MQLLNKRALLVGAATGIGRATALHFAQEGARVVIGDIKGDEGERTAAEIKGAGGVASFIQADVADEAQVKNLVDQATETLDGLDTLVNLAGVQRYGMLQTFATEEWDLIMDVNLRGMFFTMKYAIPHLERSGTGSVVNVASTAAMKGGAGSAAYSASKGGIMSLSKAMAAELTSARIRVNCVCPGFIDTPFNQPAIDFLGGKEQQAALVKQVVGMKRQGEAGEVAPAITFLASDAASYITGIALVVDGGFT